MAMRAVLTGAALVGAGVTLCGCGSADEKPTPAPTPVPVADGPVQKAWNNHFSAFGAGAKAGLAIPGPELETALTDIMKDYDSDSTIAVFNDKCSGNNADTTKITGYAVYTTPDQIKDFFRKLFTQLKSDANQLDAVGPSGGSPVVKEGDKPDGNVFLTWRTTGLAGANDIKYATDSFSWQIKAGAAKVWKQNIVTTEPQNTCAAEMDAPVKACAADADNAVCKGWDNHFAAFGAGAGAAGVKETLDEALVKIMLDYTADSLVQVFDNTNKKYETFQGLDKIKDMFRDLFTAIDAAKVGTDIGLKVLLLEVEPKFNGVFLVWQSKSHPKATDTFVFNDAGKIIRQNIVVETPAAGSGVNVQV